MLGTPAATGSSSRWIDARDRDVALFVALWLGATAVAAFFALIVSDSTIIGNVYIPRTNDSFYHARRILDAAVGERGFYQFDDRLHVPDGTWIPWPWAYDYFMAKATQAALWLRPGLEPMAFISYVPVAWIAVNAALFLAAARALGLSRGMLFLAMLCFSLSPLTQLLHAIGMIDHHYVEHTFVLLCIWLGLSWFKQPSGRRWAAALGASLGCAPAFHNELFVLQIVPLATVFVLWLRRAEPPRGALLAFAAALLVATQLVLLPSEPYRRGMFEFGLLSWFHFYIALSTSVALVYMGWRPPSRARLAGLLALCAGLAVPIATQLLTGAVFVSGGFSILPHIVEAHSVYKLFTDTYGPSETASYYSWLLLIAPFLVIFYGYRVFKERTAPQIFFAIIAVLGLGMLLAQFRFHYFGFFALIAGSLLFVDRVRERFQWHRGGVFVATFAAMAVLYQPALRERLFTIYAPGADTEYASSFTIFLDLARLCAEDPGVVLADPDDGSPILFHSECSVLSNNFILTREDDAKINEIGRLMRLSPEEIRAQAPEIKYLFVRVRDFSTFIDNHAILVENSPIAKQLLLDETPPEGFTLIRTVRRRMTENDVAGIYARLYKITPLTAAN